MLVLRERLEIRITNAISAHLRYVSTRRRMPISSVVPNNREEVLFTRSGPYRVLRRAALRTTKQRYVFVLRISGCSSEHAPPYSFRLLLLVLLLSYSVVMAMLARLTSRTATAVLASGARRNHHHSCGKRTNLRLMMMMIGILGLRCLVSSENARFVCD